MHQEMYLSEREIMHVLRCMHSMQAISEEELLSLNGAGHLDCEALSISCTREDCLVVSLMMGEAQILFKTLENFQSCGPLCMGILQLKADHQCSICFEDEKCGRWVPRLECGHIFHDDCLLRWVKSINAMSNSCPVCRRLINNKKQIRIKMVVYEDDETAEELVIEEDEETTENSILEF